uniref:Alpha-galactosidase NEW3 domain-containing protein n=1 Tax=Candidatus Methanogaster sp. ANME-2c ERB4 TaxID=2759911 RepID=A0A7G9YRP5_9EURY|nr:hypothetical protein FFGHKCHG_00033 [Methanosarcinales archaeon ANME-2c ERB4]
MTEAERRTFQATVHTSMHQEDLPDTNFSKLRISPRSDWIEMMPGDSKEITVTVKNIDNRTISIDPEVIISPRSEYVFDEDWIVMRPVVAELKPDFEEEFSFMVEIPAGAECGRYNVQVAFTDEMEQMPYLTPRPHHINAFRLMVGVWKPPVIRVLPSHIHDRVESDRGYDYQIYIENVGEKNVGIDPEMSDDGWYYELYSTAPAFENDAITVDAPSVVPAGGNATVNLHLSVPAGAKGRYHGELDLNIDDPAMAHEWYGETSVHLSFEVWTQPTEPFVKAFTTETDARIAIELVSNWWGRYGTCRSGSSHDEDPFFDVALAGPNGAAVLNLTRIVIRGSVNLGGSDCIPPPPGLLWETGGDDVYNEERGEYREHYIAATGSPIGDWELEILPHYVEEFEYTIAIGEAG